MGNDNEPKAEKKSKGKTTLVIIACLTLCVIFVYIESYMSEQEHQEHQEYLKKHYQSGLQELKVEKYKEARLNFVVFTPKGSNEFSGEYANGKYLYYFACAHDPSHDIELQKSYLDEIPLDYSGPYANEIKSYKLKVESLLKKEEENKKQQEKENKIEAANAAKERAKHLYVGDPESKIKDVYGTPDDVNTTTTKYGTRKQYVYPNGHYIYTEDGEVTSFQN